MGKRYVVFLAVWSAIGGFSTAVERHVPAEYPTIQAAIYAAGLNDEVVIAPGTYTGSGNSYIELLRKWITIRSADPNDPTVVTRTVIDCQGTEDKRGQAFRLLNEDPRSEIAGLTIVNGFVCPPWTYPGGGAIMSIDSQVTIRNCIFRHCTSTKGGAIFYEGGAARLIGCTFSDNIAGYGGGVYVRRTDAAGAVIDNCTFINNNATYNGGGAYIDCWFDPNFFEVTDCLFRLNHCDDKGGALHVSESMLVRGCEISGNTALLGAAIYKAYGSLELVNCTIADNSSEQWTAGIYNRFDAMTVANCLLWGNRLDGAASFTAQIRNDGIAEITRSCIEGLVPDPCGTNIGDNPLFADLGHYDTFDNWIEGDYHLGPGSPCIDTGDNSLYTNPTARDRDGVLRVLDGSGDGIAVVDIGAYEYYGGRPILDVEPRTATLGVSTGRYGGGRIDLTVKNGGDGLLEWSASLDCDWILIDHRTGQSEGEPDIIRLTADTTEIPPGDYACFLTLSAPGAICDGQVVEINIHVTAGTTHVPVDFDNIQAAVDHSVDGDVVIVAPGTYTGPGNHDIDFKGKAITVRGSDLNDPDVIAATVIDCYSGHLPLARGFQFVSGEGRGSVLAGLKIINGRSVRQPNPDGGNGTVALGGAVYCEASSPIISRCIMADNGTTASSGKGGAICSLWGSPRIEYCIFRNNNLHYSSYGGAIYSSGPSLEVVGCLFADNFAVSGGAIYAVAGVIEGCTIVNNTFDGVFCRDGSVRNCIMWGNWCVGGDLRETQISRLPGVTVSYCCVEGGFGGIGNMAVDPCFADPCADDWSLTAVSPCINAGDPQYVASPGQLDIGVDPRVINGRIDIGADEFPMTGPVIWTGPRLHRVSSMIGENPDDVTFEVTNSGADELDWRIVSDSLWAIVDPTQGVSTSDTNEINVSFDTSQLEPGTYTAQLRIEADGAVNTGQKVLITLVLCNILHVPAQYQTIQAALDTAVDFDHILIADGIYRGLGNRDLDFRGKQLVLRSTNGPQDCIIDCQGSEAEPHRGIDLYYSDPNTVIRGLTITNGYGLSEPDDCYGGGGGAIRLIAASPLIIDCVLIGNDAHSGGAVQNIGYEPTFINCLICGNHANYGGAIADSGASSTYINCTIIDNRSKGWAGAAFAVSSSSRVNLFNCIVRDNHSAWHDIQFAGDCVSPAMVSMVDHCSEFVMAYCNIENRLELGESFDHVIGHIDADPRFVAPGYWDPNGTIDDPNDDYWVMGDYHLKSQGWRWDVNRGVWTWDDVTSPCIDAGNPGYPLGDELATSPGDPTGQFGENVRINMGTYGGTAEASISPHGWALLSDMTNDGIVTAEDFTVLTERWDEIGAQIPCDLNRDGQVDSRDLAILASQWLEQTSWAQTH